MKFSQTAPKPTEVSPICQRVQTKAAWRPLEEFRESEPELNVVCVVCPECKLA